MAYRWGRVYVPWGYNARCTRCSQSRRPGMDIGSEFRSIGRREQCRLLSSPSSRPVNDLAMVLKCELEVIVKRELWKLTGRLIWTVSLCPWCTTIPGVGYPMLEACPATVETPSARTGRRIDDKVNFILDG